MGFLARAVAGSSKAIGPMDLFRDMLNRTVSASGKTVNDKTALEVATVFACMRVIGEGIAQVPLKLMRKESGGKERLEATDHPLYDLLESGPNDWQTSFEYMEMIGMHAVLCGNHYSFINRSNRSGIMELIPFEPGSVTVKRDEDFALTYDVRADNGSVQTFPSKAIWHVKGPSWNSWKGLDAVKLAREAIGLSMAIEEQQARTHKNGVKTSGVYSVDGTLGPEQYKSLKKWIDDNLSGPENAGKPMLLDRAAKWLNTSMTGVDAQTLETRIFQISEICRVMRVSPIMVYGDEKLSTYAGSSAGFLNHLVHTLAPWYQRLERSINKHLLTPAERASGMYANFVEEGLLRGSAVETKDVIIAYVNGGIITPNEGRARLDMNPDSDPESDRLRVPANIVGDKPAQPPVPDV